MHRPRFSHLLLLALATAAVLAPGLATIPLVEPTEGRYASIAKAMLDSGDWVVPRFNGLPHLEKPPLAYWAAAASMGVFGKTELAVRIPVALCAVLLVLIVAWLGTSLFGRRTGLLAAVLLLSCAQFAEIERALATDPFLAVSATLAIAAFWEGYRAETAGRSGRGAFWVMQLAIAAGVLAKGPLGILWPLLAIVPALAAARQPGLLRRMGFEVGLLLIAATTGLWLAALDWRLPGAVAYMVLDRSTAAARSSHGFHAAPWWFYLAVFPAAFMPWVLLAPEALLRHRTPALDAQARTARVLLASWVLVPLVLFSLFPAKLPSYIFPSYAGAAILVAWGMGEEARGGLRVAVAMGVLFAALGVAALVWPADRMKGFAFLAEHRSAVAVPAFLAAAVALASALFARGARRIVGVALSMAVLGGGAAIGAPLGEEEFSSRSLALRLQHLHRPGDAIVFYQCEPSGVPFYTGLRGIEVNFEKLKTPARIADEISDAAYWNREGPDALSALLKGPSRVLGIGKAAGVDRVIRQGTPIGVIARSGRLVLFAGPSPPEGAGKESGWHPPR